MNTILLPCPYRYRLRFKALAPIELPAYSGSAWRGLLGHGLRKVSCVTRAKRCQGCLLLARCVYAHVFESNQSATDDVRFRTRPHPFVLTLLEQGARLVPEGGLLGLELSLLGAANAHLPYLIQGMVEGGRLGLGRSYGRFVLDGVLQESQLGKNDWQDGFDPETGHLDIRQSQRPHIPAAPQAVQITLHTPLRIKRKGKLIGPREFQASDFLRQLWRRAQNLAQFYGDEHHGIELVLPEARADELDAQAQKKLRWHDWSRYSSRQKTRMQMGGVIGQLQLQGPALQEWWPLIWLGQWLHLGKATSMGLGQYRLHMPQAYGGQAAQRQQVS